MEKHKTGTSCLLKGALSPEHRGDRDTIRVQPPDGPNWAVPEASPQETGGQLGARGRPQRREGRWRTQALRNRCPGFWGRPQWNTPPPPGVSALTRSVRAHPGGSDGLLEAAGRRAFHSRPTPDLQKLTLSGRVAVWGLWVLCPRPREKTSIGLARCSSHLFLCPPGAWRAALLPRNHKARAAEALGSCRGGTGKPPASP